MFLYFIIFIYSGKPKIRFGDAIQIQNVGTSTYLACGPRKRINDTSNLVLFTTYFDDREEIFWTIESVEPESKKIECNSMISIFDPNIKAYINAGFLFESTHVYTSDTRNPNSLWNVTCIDEEDAYWLRGKPVLFKNLEQKCYLSSSLDEPVDIYFPNRWKLNCIPEASKNSFWKTEKGIFFLKKKTE